eukprot:7006865-Prymnesium_polylepis.1
MGANCATLLSSCDITYQDTAAGIYSGTVRRRLKPCATVPGSLRVLEWLELTRGMADQHGHGMAEVQHAMSSPFCTSSSACCACGYIESSSAPPPPFARVARDDGRRFCMMPAWLLLDAGLARI